MSGTIKHFVRYTGQNQSGLSTKDISCQVEGTISFNQPASITLSKNIINVQCIRGGNCVTEPIQHIISGTGALSLIIDGDGPLVIQSNGNSFQVTPRATYRTRNGTVRNYYIHNSRKAKFNFTTTISNSISTRVNMNTSLCG